MQRTYDRLFIRSCQVAHLSMRTLTYTEEAMMNTYLTHLARNSSSDIRRPPP